MPTLDERRTAAQKRLQRINDKAFDLVAELAALREERKSLMRSLKTMGQRPAHLQRNAKMPASSQDIGEVAPIARRAPRLPPGVPGGVEKARAKLAEQGITPRPHRARKGASV